MSLTATKTQNQNKAIKQEMNAIEAGNITSHAVMSTILLSYETILLCSFALFSFIALINVCFLCMTHPWIWKLRFYITSKVINHNSTFLWCEHSGIIPCSSGVLDSFPFTLMNYDYCGSCLMVWNFHFKSLSFLLWVLTNLVVRFSYVGLFQ